jgi:hypothetical protein
LLALVGVVADEHDAGTPRATATAGGRQSWQIDVQSREAVRQFWLAGFADTAPSGFWQGDAAQCDPGNTLRSHRRDTLARINAYRALAGVPADMEEDPAASRKTQAAVLVVARNNRIAHSIDPSWQCYSDDAREGAKISLLGLGQNGSEAVTEFMRDAGAANGGVNHRRWLLFPKTKFLGMGDIPAEGSRRAASGFTAFDALFDGNRPAVRDDYIAWPPRGWVPYPLVFPRWSFSLAGADFSEATLQVLRQGETVPITIEPPDPVGAGEPTLVWRMDGLADNANWPRPQADTAYDIHLANVRVGSVLTRFDYRVQVFDPESPHPDNREAVAAGPAQLNRDGGDYLAPLLPGTNTLQWRALAVTPASLVIDPSKGLRDISYTGRNDYPILQGSELAQGRQVFRLAHPGMGDEMLTLAQPLVLGPASRLTFRNRRAIGGSDEIATVEVQVDGRTGWTVVWRQQGDGQPRPTDAAFTDQVVDLSAYAHRLVHLRFRYAFAGGSFYAPDDARIGWYLDNIRLDQVFQRRAAFDPQAVVDGQFHFQPATAGEWRLQVRPVVYGATGSWGPLLPVSVE